MVPPIGTRNAGVPGVVCAIAGVTHTRAPANASSVLYLFPTAFPYGMLRSS